MLYRKKIYISLSCSTYMLLVALFFLYFGVKLTTTKEEIHYVLSLDETLPSLMDNFLQAFSDEQSIKLGKLFLYIILGGAVLGCVFASLSILIFKRRFSYFLTMSFYRILFLASGLSFLGIIKLMLFNRYISFGIPLEPLVILPVFGGFGIFAPLLSLPGNKVINKVVF